MVIEHTEDLGIKFYVPIIIELAILNYNWTIENITNI